jgi:hypothetical protein
LALGVIAASGFDWRTLAKARLAFSSLGYFLALSGVVSHFALPSVPYPAKYLPLDVTV